MSRVKQQDPARYAVQTTHASDDEDAIIDRAIEILHARAMRGNYLTSPADVIRYLTVSLSGLGHEVFGCIWLDSQHGVIEDDELFRGTLSQTSVYPREVMKSALRLNAAAVVLYHNHPSGKPEPSRADEHLTRTLAAALTLIDVRVLDHIVVGGGRSVSFAEKGLI